MVMGWPDMYVPQIKIADDVFGVENDSTWIMKEDILSFCDLDKIGATVMSLWCSYLQTRFLNHSGLNKVYAFLNPSWVGNKAGSYAKRVTNLSQRLSDIDPDQFLVSSWIDSKHWMVILIQPSSQRVAFLDPLNGLMPGDIEKVVKEALMKYNLQNSKKANSRPNITYHKCRLQPDIVQCGYYCMKFIQELMIVPNPTRHLATKVYTIIW
ncbi:hypothetical protein CsatA_028342 [Cannabis sativa]